MDPVSQATIGALAPASVFDPRKARAAALLGGVAGLAPDVDVFVSSPVDSLLFLEYHRQFTHALLFVPVGAAVVALAGHWLVRRQLRPWQSYLACLLGYATHGLLDACTSYGTQLFWPFADVRVAWNNVSVVDPLFTAPVLALVVASLLCRRRTLAWAALAWGVAYLAFGAVQNQRAENAGAALAAARGHAPARLAAKPGFANLLLWKTVYEHRGRYYVDAVRTGFHVAACPGASVPVLNAPRDLPWLDANSQQARDVERFRWFSADYVALDPAAPYRVIDIRYSMVPNRMDPLWGIELRPSAAPAEHARFVADRRIEGDEYAALLRLLRGTGCERIG